MNTPKAAPMTTDAKPAPAASPIALTAEQLFTTLARDAVVIGDNNAKMKIPPESLARLSFELAKAFHKYAQEQHAAANKPVAAFSTDMFDVDAWTKKDAG